MEIKRIRNEALEQAAIAAEEVGSRDWVAKKLLDTITTGPTEDVSGADINRATSTYITLMGFSENAAADYSRMSMPDLMAVTKRRFLPVIKALGAKTREKRKAFDED